jgi:AcrR family transcriptional regulator
MFIDNVNAKAVSSGKPRGRGRPPGPTAQGREARARLYKTAIRLMTQRGYEGTTMRDVAAAAGVSPGLLYRYFPSKRAVVLALYEELSAEYAAQGALMPRGSWRARFRVALDASLRVLGPHRRTLSALVPVLIGDSQEGLFAPATAFSRQRVLRVYLDAVSGASDAPKTAVGEPLGRLLYLVHLAVLMWWLLDKSPRQRATTALVALIDRAMSLAGLALRLGPVQGIVRSGDALFREALFDDAAAG